MRYYLDFEKPVQELDLKIEELKRLSNGSGAGTNSELQRLEQKAGELRKHIFSRLTPWQKTLIARHPDRPYTSDYIRLLTDDFIELHGDRKFSDDKAIIGGIGSISDTRLVIIGHQKGRGTKERIVRNFGQPHPEGYRKALRLMHLGVRFKLPILTFIDTPGAFPGIGAEERGQAVAIATSLMEMSLMKTQIVSIVIGEGGSGGALALSVADRLLMLENSVYSVISPEGCAAILWNKNDKLGAKEYSRAAESLKLTARDLFDMKIIDDIVPEPMGGAHIRPEKTAQNIKDTVLKTLKDLQGIPLDVLLKERYEKLLRIGVRSGTEQG